MEGGLEIIQDEEPIDVAPITPDYMVDQEAKRRAEEESTAQKLALFMRYFIWIVFFEQWIQLFLSSLYSDTIDN